MTVDALRPTGAASDSLMLQVNEANVLAVHALLSAQAEAIETALEKANFLRSLPRIADDMVSKDARDAFQPKVDQIRDLHQAHALEVRDAATRLEEAAKQYRYTEEDISAALSSARERFGLPPLQGR